MFSCRCNTPSLPASSCVVHQKTPGKVTVMLGRPRVVHQVNIPSEVKHAAFTANRCRSCNAEMTGAYGHVCTRHPSEPESAPNPWD